MRFCEVCGKVISNTESLRHSMGPVCWKKHKAYQETLIKIAFNERDNVVPIEEVRSA